MTKLDSLPATLTKYVQEFRIHLNVQQAASTLAKHFKKVSDKSFVGSRNESAPKECSMCCFTKEDYFVLSCSHGAFCEGCISRFSNCPICRKMITSTKSISLNLFDKKLFIY